jgi:hypothetical protein
MPVRGRHSSYCQPSQHMGAARGEAAGAPFDYLFPALTDCPEAHLPAGDAATDVILRLKELARAMVGAADESQNNSTIPAIYTYWGQFITHELTAHTDFDAEEDFGSSILRADFQPQPPTQVQQRLRNLRSPQLDLDCLYDVDETAYKPDGVTMRLGRVYEDGVYHSFTEDIWRDLPRAPDKRAIIGDPRNDDNLLVAQFHVAFLKYHNQVVKWVASEEHLSGPALLARTQQLTRWHYQWLIVNDYLRRVAQPQVVEQVLMAETHHFIDHLFMPLEFAVAAFRFGHSMVRGRYDIHQYADGGHRQATFKELFRYTGPGDLGGYPALPSRWIVDWQLFTNKENQPPHQAARRIGVNLTPPMTYLIDDLTELTGKIGVGFATPPSTDEFELPPPMQEIILHQAIRDLLRGYLFSLPVGQAVCDALSVQKLTPDQLLNNNPPAINQALLEGCFLERTPLWFYLLKEAEMQTGGDALGEAGSHIVAQTLIGLLKADGDSYINQDWEPRQGVRLPNGEPILKLTDLLRFAGVLQ